MGYNSKLRGRLVFDPPISEQLSAEIDEKFDNLSYAGYFDKEGWYDEGETGKMYYLEEEVRELVALLNDFGSTVSGTIVVEGEEATDIWRIVIDGDIKVEKAAVRWPDGTEYRVR